jgi:hypothetical protein
MKTSLFAFKIFHVNPHMQGKGNMGDFFDTTQDDLGEKFNILEVIVSVIVKKMFI